MPEAKKLKSKITFATGPAAEDPGPDQVSSHILEGTWKFFVIFKWDSLGRLALIATALQIFNF